MRFALGALLLVSLSVSAAEAPLRFVVSDSWAMPMVQMERGRPTQGILHDIMLSLATQVGVPAQFHVLPRARVQNAMEHGEVDVRCYVSKSWLPNLSGNYIWSAPLLVQRDLLIGRRDSPDTVNPADLPQQSIGTVLGYSYPTLQPLFDADRLHRDDARNQEQVLDKLLAGRYRYAVSSQWTLDCQPAPATQPAIAKRSAGTRTNHRLLRAQRPQGACSTHSGHVAAHENIRGDR